MRAHGVTVRTFHVLDKSNPWLRTLFVAIASSAISTAYFTGMGVREGPRV